MSMKNSYDNIGNRTRDLPACSHRVPHVKVIALCIPSGHIEQSLADNINIARIKNGKSELIYRFARVGMCSRNVDKAPCVLNPGVQ